jgi:tetratricopeptide (TPR) repeat protein
MRSIHLSCALLFFLILWAAGSVFAQGDQMLYGDVSIDESKVEGLKPLSFDLILYTEGGIPVGRQSVSNNGRYRFNNLAIGIYQLVVEAEGREVTRMRVDLRSPLVRDLRQDIALEWRSTGGTAKSGVISAADKYARGAANETLFKQAREAMDKKEYDRAADLLQRIVKADAKDFQAWTELANVHYIQKNSADAENEYLRALDAHPGFFLALINLGRLEVAERRYDVAIEALARAVKAQPQSADANYLLGESYLQMKKGSLAVPYLSEALRLDPQGMAEVHLRLALLYHGAGMKDKAAAEYEEFLKKKPDYPERKKLEQYIAENKRK